MDAGLIIAGLVVGVLVGLTGVGGGSLMTPTLIYGFSVPPAVAVGTDLIFAAVTKSGATWMHALRGTVQWVTVWRLAAGSLPATLITLWWLRSEQRAGFDVGDLMTTALGGMLILTALALLNKRRLIAFARRSPVSLHPRALTLATIVVGALLGVFVTLTSVGAGALGVVALFFLYPSLVANRIVGVDIAHATLLTAVAGLGHWHLGTVDFALLAQLLLGSLPGIYIGTHCCARFPEHIVQRVLAAALLVTGVRFVF